MCTFLWFLYKDSSKTNNFKQIYFLILALNFKVLNSHITSYKKKVNTKLKKPKTDNNKNINKIIYFLK